MSAYRTQMDARVIIRNGPKGDLLKHPAHLDYRNKAEMCTQLRQFARGIWTKAKRIDIDTNAGQIMVDGELVASYVLNEPKHHTGTTEALL